MMISEPGKERLEGKAEERTAVKPAGAFSRFKKGLTEGLVIAGVCMTLVGKAGCTYEVPALDAIPDAGPDVSQREDAGERPDSGNVQEEDAGHDAGAGGSDGGSGGMDAGHDGGSGGMDAGLDAGEGGMDGGSGGMDAGLDAGEGGMDAGLDAGEGGMDAGPVDSGSPDAGILCGSVTTGAFSGFISLTTQGHVANYTFTYHGIDGMGQPLISISCTEGEFETSTPFPLGVDTAVSRPDDGVPAGRTITIHPSAANASNTTLAISVTHP